MTLGDMIKEYLKDNTMTDFAKESGLSRAYAYLLIKNKNNSGGEIVPTIETVKKVAKGLHMTFEEVIALLDDNAKITINKPVETPSPEEWDILNAYRNAPDFVRSMVLYNLGLPQGGEKDGNGKV